MKALGPSKPQKRPQGATPRVARDMGPSWAKMALVQGGHIGVKKSKILKYLKTLQKLMKTYFSQLLDHFRLF